MRKISLTITSLVFSTISAIFQPDAKAMCGEGEGEGWVINTTTGQTIQSSTGSATMCSATNLYGAFDGAAFKASYKRDSYESYKVTINGVTKSGMLGKISRGSPFCVRQLGSSLRYCWIDSTW